MKSKLVILSLLLAGVVGTATAQTKEKFYSERWTDNWYIGVGGGIHMNTNPDNWKNIGDAIAPTINVTLGKLIDPVWGIRGQVAGAWSNRIFDKNRNNDIENKHFVSLRAQGTFNVSNALAGYNPDRVFSLYAFMGPGLTLAKAYGKQDNVNVLVNGSAGLGADFVLSKYFDIFVEVTGEVNPSIFGKKGRAYTDGAISAVAGVSYTFGGKKFIPVGSKIDTKDLENEINRYRKALQDAETDLAACRNAIKDVKPETITKTEYIDSSGARAVFFQIGKSNIDDYGMVNIQLAAKAMKANTNKKYKIAGYADKATGSAGWNQKLSEKRAQAVYDALLKEGVSASQLELVGHGGTANMFGQNKLNRVVILE